MFEIGPHKPAVEMTGLRPRICEILQDYDEKVQGLVQPLESLQDNDDKVKTLEVERAALKEGAVKIVQEYNEKVQGLVQALE